MAHEHKNRSPSATPFGILAGTPGGLVDRKEAIAFKKAEELTVFKAEMSDIAKGLPRGEQAMFRMFSGVGKALGEKLRNKQDLTPKEDRSLKIMENSNKKMRDRKGEPDFIAMSPIEQADEQERIIMNEAMLQGDNELFRSLARDLHEKQTDRAAAQTTQDAAELELEDRRAESPNRRKSADVSMQQLLEGKPANAVRTDSSGLPDLNAPTTVKVLPDGTMVDAITGEKVAFGDVMLLDDALALQKTRDKIGSGSEKPELGELLNSMFLGKEVEKFRTGLTDINQLVSIVGELASSFEAGDPASIVGTPGKLNTFVQNTIAVIKAGGRTIGWFANYDPETGEGIGPMRSMNDQAQELISDDMVPPQLRTNATAAARYKAAIMQMVYADARLNEPGARQLSDKDIQNAMDRLGVNSSDPATVIAVFSSAMRRRLQNKRPEYERFSNIVSFAAGDTKKNVFKTLGANPLELIDDAVRNVDASFARASAAVGGAKFNAKESSVVEGSGLTTAGQQTIDDILNR